MSVDTSQTCVDTIDGYLSSALVSKETLRREGVLGYWQKQQKKTPRVARFALGLLSAPGMYSLRIVFEQFLTIFVNSIFR